MPESARSGANGHGDVDLRELRPPATTADRFAPIGRALLWLVLAIIFIRGISAIVSPEEEAPVTGPQTAAWPDAAAEAFAIDFARTYLSFPGEGDPDELSEQHNAAVDRFLTPALRGDTTSGAALPGQGVSQLFYSGEVSKIERVDDEHALITVEALVQQEVPGGGRRTAFSGPKRLFVAVPVGRDTAGRLALYAHPSLVAEARVGAPEQLDTEALADPGAAEIEDLVERFLGDYLAGAGAGELSFYLAPGARLPSLDGGYRLIELSSVEQVGDDGEREREVLATAVTRDLATGATYNWQYQLGVEHRDRWYVTGIGGAPGSGNRRQQSFNERGAKAAGEADARQEKAPE